MKDALLKVKHLKRYRDACSLIRQACINRGSWPVWQRGTFWMVREGDWGYDEKHINTPLEIVPGVQVYGEG